MPKVKDLGVTVVPEQFGPMEVGGGGCAQSFCSDCTNVQFSICGTTPGGPQARGGGGCTDCTMQAFSICGTTPGGGGCTDCTRIPYSICGTTPGACTDCTNVPFSICGTTPTVCANFTLNCGVTAGAFCRLLTINPTWTHCGGTWETPCGGSFGDPWGRRGGGGLTQQGINQIRQQLQAQMAQLDEAEKALAPQTAAELDAREKELTAELDKIKAARSSMKKK